MATGDNPIWTQKRTRTLNGTETLEATMRTAKKWADRSIGPASLTPRRALEALDATGMQTAKKWEDRSIRAASLKTCRTLEARTVLSADSTKVGGSMGPPGEPKNSPNARGTRNADSTKVGGSMGPPGEPKNSRTRTVAAAAAA